MIKKILAFNLLFTCGSAYCDKLIKIGFFPNLTHLHALIAQNFARDGRGWFERYIPGCKIEWSKYNAGPSAMEGIIAGAIDMTYVGPVPVCNLFVRSGGAAIKILSGAVYGGSVLVVRADLAVEKNEDWRGRCIASPQFGNTQDVVCRKWLTDNGLKVGFGKDDVKVMPTDNPGQLILFANKSIDGAWTVEPWASRLVNEACGKVYFSDKTSLTTLLSARTKFVEDNPEIAKKVIEAHSDMTKWINDNKDEACVRLQDEFMRQTRTTLPIETIRNCINSLVLDNDVTEPVIKGWIDAAMSLNLIPSSKKIQPITQLFISESAK